MASTYISRTNGTATNSQKMTISTWFKIGTQSAQQNLISTRTGGGPYAQAVIMTAATYENIFRFDANSVEGNGIDIQLNRSLRDPGAWYHLVIGIDTTQSVASDRLKVYINGVQETSFATSTYPTEDDTLDLTTSGAEVQVGAYNNTQHWTGSMSHVNLIDGLQYAASDFGETDVTSGIWKPNVAPSVTYGTNGFSLKMEDRTNLDLDSSPNAHTMTTTGTLTATYDNPSNNFCTINPLDNYFPNMTFTNGNLTVKSDHPATAKATMGLSAGKWYFEGKAAIATPKDYTIGISSTQVVATSNEIGHFPDDWAYYGDGSGSNGAIRNNDATVDYGDEITTGSIIGCALDLTNSNLYFSKNGVWQNSGVPTSGGTGTGAVSITAVASTPLGNYFPSMGADASGTDYTWNANFGNGYFGTTVVASTNADDAGIGSFEYDVPAGFYAICTKNLATYG